MPFRFTSLTSWALFIAILAGLLGVTKFVSSMAQESPREKRNWKVKKVGPKRMGINAKKPDSTDENDGTIEDQIPPRVPMEVEIKNLKTDSLLRDIEIKVTNTATKPIYFLELGIVLPDNLSSEGYPINFHLRYGRPELIKFDSPREASDIPLQPGESIVLKIPDNNLAGFERLVAKGKISQAEVKRVFLVFVQLNFGDKTGFSGSGGSPVPRVRKERAKNGCNDNEAIEAIEAFGVVASGRPISASFSEASFVRAKFSRGKSPPQSNLCCPASPPATPCSFLKEDTYYCQCGIGRTVAIVGCQDPAGECADSVRRDSDCVIAGVEYTCVEFFKAPCSAYCDVDNDDWYAVSCGGLDCDDNDPTITPFSPECATPTPTPTPTPPRPECSIVFEQNCYDQFGRVWNPDTCRCENPMFHTPILVDTLGNGFSLTDASSGVAFDMSSDGLKEQLAWTAMFSDDAFLALDRNGNGRIDNGAELFGNFTSQPRPPAGEEKNGFLALAEFDKPENGGNGDGVIKNTDSVFSRLRLWQDTNHNGFSEPSELHTLMDLGLKTLELDYKKSRRTDQYGNQFRYRSKVQDVHDAQLGRWAWDVFLVAQ